MSQWTGGVMKVTDYVAPPPPTGIPSRRRRRRRRRQAVDAFDDLLISDASKVKGLESNDYFGKSHTVKLYSLLSTLKSVLKTILHLLSYTVKAAAQNLVVIKYCIKFYFQVLLL